MRMDSFFGGAFTAMLTGAGVTALVGKPSATSFLFAAMSIGVTWLITERVAIRARQDKREG